VARFKLERSDGFMSDYRAKEPDAQGELDDVLRFLEEVGPQHNSLNSHKITDKRAKREERVQVWESYITWRHRLTWHYERRRRYVIYLRATDGHEILPRRK